MSDIIQTTKDMLKLSKLDLAKQAGFDGAKLLQHNDASVITAQIKKLKTYLECIEDSIKEAAINEVTAEMLPTSIEVNRYGVVFSVAQGSDTLDFEADQQYKELNDALKDRRQELAHAYKMSFRGEKLVNGDDEIIPVVPVKKAGSTQLRARIL